MSSMTNDEYYKGSHLEGLLEHSVTELPKMPTTNMGHQSIESSISTRVDRTGSFMFNDNKEVEVSGSISFRGYAGDKLFVPFAFITDTLNCELASISTLENMPESVGALNLSNCAKLTNLNFPRPITISETLDISKTSITSLHNIHKNIKFVKSIVARDCNFTDSLAGLLLIEGLLKFQSSMNNFDTIINKYLTTSRDPHLCAEELGQAGFEYLLEL